ncbi:MAG: type II toxin-antitoxin system VapC family toxin [Gammaproteobacteria bacterium]
MNSKMHSDFVLDASVALAWCFADESTEATNQLLEAVLMHKAHVPNLFHLEISNIILNAVRRNRISYARMTKYIELLNKLDLQIDSETSNRAFHEILQLSYSHGLTTYDAAYLELSLRLGLPLASRDKVLCKVAKNLGVALAC